jgi:membrane protein HdeD
MGGSTPLAVERRRTGADLVLGLLAVVAGVVVLGHVAIASLVSVLFIGWLLVVGGVVLVVGGIAGWKDPGRRWDVAAGALLAVLGFVLVTNPGAGLLALTLLAGSLLLVGGIVRIVAAFQPGTPRGLLLVNGVVTLLLGVLVLGRWPVSALWFLGTVLGVQLVLDGLTVAISGRVRPVEPASGPTAGAGA